MKYLKLFAIMLGAVAFASCSSDDDKHEINTDKSVTVSMAEPELSFMENKGIVQIPVKVTGESNGYITVTCSVDELGAMEDVHFLMTSQSIAIEPGATEAYFEVRLVDDRQENEPRLFSITLETADGAQIGDPNTTIIEITDNDHEPYDRMGGEWYLMIDGGVRGTVTFNASAPGQMGYGEYYTVTGLVDYTTVKADFHWDEGTKCATITFNYGDAIVSIDGGEYEGYLCWLNGGYIGMGQVQYLWNTEENPTEITWLSGPQEGAADFVVVYFDDDGGYIADQRTGVSGFSQD